MDGKQLKAKLQTTGRSMVDISTALGMSAQALNSYFQVSDIKTGILEKLCIVLNVDMGFFYPIASTQYTQVTNNGHAHNNTATGNVEGNSELVQQLLDMMKKKDEQIDRLLQSHK